MTKYQRLCYDTAVRLEKDRPEAFDGQDTGVADIRYWHELVAFESRTQRIIRQALKVSK